MQQTVFYSSIQNQVYLLFGQMENFIAVWTHEANSAPVREMEFCPPVHKDVVNYTRQFCSTSKKKLPGIIHSVGFALQ